MSVAQMLTKHDGNLTAICELAQLGEAVLKLVEGRGSQASEGAPPKPRRKRRTKAEMEALRGAAANGAQPPPAKVKAKARRAPRALKAAAQPTFPLSMGSFEGTKVED